MSRAIVSISTLVKAQPRIKASLILEPSAAMWRSSVVSTMVIKYWPAIAGSSMRAPTVTTIPAQLLDAKSFSPYGEVIYPRAAGSQFDNNPYDPETSTEEPRLTLANGTPRLWIMRLKKNGLAFSKLARHRRVSQCLGSLQGKEWFIAVAPPNDMADGARPELARMAAFRIPGDCVIKLHVATWHAGPHFMHDECLFFNLENLDTNKRDFEDYELPNAFRISP